MAVIPRGTGHLGRGNILVSNFNNKANVQGTGTTIVQITPRGLELEGFDGSLAQERQLHLRHRALHAQQQPIVGGPGIVDGFFVDN